jgi:hypothetical protein
MVRAAPQPQPSAPQWHGPFLLVLPVVQKYARRSFAGRGRQVREEAVAEVIGHAMIAVRNMVRRGKDPTKFPGYVARFAVLRVKNGRLVTGTAEGDIFSQLAHERHGLTVRSLNDDDGNAIPGWRAAVVQDDRHCTPADVCCFKLDFEDWLGTLPRQQRRLATRLAVGDRPSQIARRLNKSPALVTKWRAILKKSWQEFRGETAEQDMAVAGATPPSSLGDGERHLPVRASAGGC